MTDNFDLFAESDYYFLLLVDELKQKNENMITFFELFSKLRHENKRIWVNCRGPKGELNNSYFIKNEDFSNPSWTWFIVTDYHTRGFYDKYYVVNCMQVICFQKYQIRCRQIAEAAHRQRQEQQRKDEAARLIGKQYNIFGGLD